MVTLVAHNAEMSPDEYCHHKTAGSRSNFYYSFLFLPKEKRQAITALYAFCREVDDIVDEYKNIDVARTKLHWWRSEIARLYQGRAQHPVSIALTRRIPDYNWPIEHFLEIINGMEMDLSHTPYANFKELSLYCYRVASVVGLMAAEIFGYQNPSTLKYAHNLGIALQLTNILRDVREDTLRGRIYLPLDELDRFGVTLEDIRQLRASTALNDLLCFQAERARGYYDQALSQLPQSDRHHQRSGLIMAAIYLALLKKIERRTCSVLERRISLPLPQKLWIVWNTARRA